MVAILGLLAAVVVPRYVSLQAGQDSRDFMSALLRIGSDARLIAIESGQAVQVTYDDSQRAVVFQTIDPDTFALSESKVIPVPGSIQLSSFTADGAFATAGDWQIAFYPDGSGLDGGIEVEDGAYVYNIVYRGVDGTSQKQDGPLEESSGRDWQAGELEQRI